MPTRSINRNISYGLGQPLITGAPPPIVAQRAPTANDFAPISTIWVDQPNDDNYILTRVVANAATWINAGGGGGVFDTVTTVNGIVCGTTLTVGTTLNVTGNTTLNTGLGVVLSSAAGLITAADGTDGQVLIASTGAAAPAWAAITAGVGINITNGAGSIQVDATGATAVSYPTDVAGPVVPTGGGAVNVLGGTNMTTDGTVANTITIDLDDDVVLVGGLTAGHDLLMNGGSMTITADDDLAQCIYIHADAGTNETIEIHADQGTGVDSIEIHSDLGGINIESGLSTIDAINITAIDPAGGIDLLAGTSGFDLDCTGGPILLDAAADSNFTVTGAFDLTLDSSLGSVNIDGGEAAADAISIQASNAAGGIDIDCGTGGYSMVCANGTVAIESGTGAINIGTDAAAKTVTLGSVTGAATTVIQSGTGDVSVTSTDAILLDATGVLELNSSGGIIGIGNDAVAQNINIATGAAARTLTLGNATGATAVAINSGSGDITATATLGSIILESTENVADAIYLHTDAGITEQIRLHSDQGTAAASILLQSDVGGVTLNGGIAGAGALTLVASDAAGGIDIDYGTGGMTIDATNGAFTLQTGTGAISLGTDAVAKTVTVGSTTGAADTVIQSGTGNTSVTSTGAILLDSAGVLEINSSGGIIGIGNDAVAQNVNISTGAAARTTTIGNTTGASSVVVDVGTGAASFGASATAHTTTIGSTNTTCDTTINAGTGGISLEAAGIVDIVPATDSQAAAAVTINANVGVGTFTGQTPGAGAQFTLTVTNSVCTASSAILCSVSNLGANDCRLSIERVTPAAGSFTVQCQNNGGAACNGDIILTFFIIAA